MILTVVSECSGESRRRTAAILDGYLPRIGGRTWMGDLSGEGADDLRAALRRSATRATAVAVFQTGRSGTPRLRFVVGRRSAFGPRGEVPVFRTQADRPRILDRTHTETLLAAVVGMSASLHDIGKLTVGFSDVLVRSALGLPKLGKQPLRHEFVSTALLRGILRDTRGDGEALEALSDTAEATRRAEAALANLPELLMGWATEREIAPGAAPRAGRDVEPLLPPADSHPVMRCVSMLVLTHHRLVAGELAEPRVGRGAVIDPESLCRMNLRDIAHAPIGRVPTRPVADFARPHPMAAAALRGAWAEHLARDARTARDALRDAPNLGREDFSSAVFLAGRLALVLGDHQASEQRRATPFDDPAAAAAATPFANTRREGSDVEDDEQGDHGDGEGREDGDALRLPAARAARGPEILADRWTWHTHRVRRLSLAALAHLRPGSVFPSLQAPDLPARLAHPVGPDPRYAWQDEAVRTLERAREEHPAADGALVFLAASTGMGKTVTAPKALIALSPEGAALRINVALGLRSLTLQTGDEYREKIGFPRDAVAVVVGSRAARAMHERSRAQAADATERAVEQPERDPMPLGEGTDAPAQAGPDLVLDGSPDVASSRLFERVADGERNASRRFARRRMLGSPVLVCTLDTLMSAADPTSTDRLGDSLRAATSDLVIDEIDSFDSEDMVAICRLITFCAFHGRRVVVSSATLREPHAAAVRDAYAHGRRLRGSVLGSRPDFVRAWVSEVAVRTSRDDAGTDAAVGFSAAHADWARAAAAGVLAVPARRRAVEWPVIPGGGLRGCLDAALAAGARLHAGNAVTDPETGVRVSVGMVRWNHTRPARALAARLLQNDPPAGFAWAVVCHHAKFPLGVRGDVAAKLSRALDRKPRPGAADPVLRDPNVRRHLQAAAQQGKTDLVVWVSATNIVEAGADLDFDWAVLEPCSERSAVQSAGRVRRHRPGAWDQTNIAILSETVRGPGSPFSGPGAETPIGAGAARFRASLPGPRRASAVFPMAAWGERLDATTCLEPSGAPSGAAELAMLEGAVLGRAASIGLLACDGQSPEDTPAHARRRLRSLSVAGLRRHPGWLWSRAVYDMRRFRRANPADDVSLAQESGVWLLRDQHSPTAARQGDSGMLLPFGWRTADRAVRHESLPRGDGTRLLLGVAIYDIDSVARRFTEKRQTVRCQSLEGHTMPTRLEMEVREIALSPRGYDPVQTRFFHHPWLGADTKALDDVERAENQS